MSPRSLMLDRLPAAELDRFQSRLQRLTLARGQVLYQASHRVEHVYFPVTARVEELLPQADGEAYPVRQIDNHSMAGSCALGDPHITLTARVVTAGTAYAMTYADFLRALDEVPSFRELVMQDVARACRVS
jgi:CRP-like cAMP-binding protein